MSDASMFCKCGAELISVKEKIGFMTVIKPACPNKRWWNFWLHDKDK